MKHSFSKWWLLVTFLPLFLLNACKKEEGTSTRPTDDPDIEVTNFNVTINLSRPTNSIDTVFKFSGNEFNVSCYKYVGPTSFKNISLYSYSSTSDEFNFQKEISLKLGDYNEIFAPTFLDGFKIDTHDGAWLDRDGYSNSNAELFSEIDANGVGINGYGDRFVAFRIGKSGSYKYGWIQLNIPADANSITIKAVGFCTKTNKTIYFGDK